MSDTIISVIGLGYVGLPVAVSFAKKYRVIGFDLKKSRIEELARFEDSTGEVDPEDLKTGTISFTQNPSALTEANFHIVAVPTPITKSKTPDLSPLHGACEIIGKNLTKGSIVVFESTVYPGATEEECVPILEEHSGLKCGTDFKVGYSPERINPADKTHTFTNIKKVVSGQDAESLKKISAMYASVVTAGVHEAPTIKVAEASKVIENTQRDINIAFMNELSKIFHFMDIDTNAVLEAAGTKWNFLNFFPGLVGGHCIGVDPYYLTHKAKELGYHSEVILSGRRVNDQMGYYVARLTLEKLIREKVNLVNASVNLMGLTFKENCPDIRNTRVLDIFNKLHSLGIKVNICDPVAPPNEVKEIFGQAPVELKDLAPADALIIAVPHTAIRELDAAHLRSLMKSPPILVDVRGLWKNDFVADKEVNYWSL